MKTVHNEKLEAIKNTKVMESKYWKIFCWRYTKCCKLKQSQQKHQDLFSYSVKQTN